MFGYFDSKYVQKYWDSKYFFPINEIKEKNTSIFTVVMLLKITGSIKSAWSSLFIENEKIIFHDFENR
jgi:hypothetical protein